MKTTSIILLTALCSASAAFTFSPDAISAELKKASNEKQAATAITFRKSLLQLVRSNMGPLGAMAKGNIPMDADVIALNASRIEFLGDMIHEYFALDTTAFSIETDAKDITHVIEKHYREGVYVNLELFKTTPITNPYPSSKETLNCPILLLRIILCQNSTYLQKLKTNC